MPKKDIYLPNESGMVDPRIRRMAKPAPPVPKPAAKGLKAKYAVSIPTPPRPGER